MGGILKQFWLGVAISLLFSTQNFAAEKLGSIGSKHGGQGLILVVSDSERGRLSELIQKIMVITRQSFYRYDRIQVISGHQALFEAAILNTAERFAKELKIVDVLVFTHGIGREISLRVNKERSHFATAFWLGRQLAPLDGKLRLFYTAACEFNLATQQFVNEAPHAWVAVSHVGLNILPLSFPLQFLKYFKADHMSAVAAVSKAWIFARYNWNPLVRLIQEYYAYEAEGYQGSRPILVGDPLVVAEDFVRPSRSKFVTDGKILD